jgi:hypothetical protein
MPVMRVVWMVALALIVGCIGKNREEAPAQASVSAPSPLLSSPRPMIRRPSLQVVPSATVR